MNADRPFRIVSAVIREALRSSGREEVVVAGEGPERRILSQWLERAGIPFRSPRPGMLDLAEGLRRRSPGSGPPPPPSKGPSPSLLGWKEEGAWAASGLAGRALGEGSRGLMVGAETKTLLLLGCHPTQATILPLGDLWASEILELAGDCSLPEGFGSSGPDGIRDVDRALRAYLEEDTPWEVAMAGLPPQMQEGVALGLNRARRLWRPRVLIPKLGEATLGIELDL